MVARKEVGLIYSYNENWIGGTYYILNLIHALNALDDVQKPHISVVAGSQKEFDQLAEETKYPYLTFVRSYPHYSIFEKIINKIGRIFLKRNIVQKDIVTPPVLFPLNNLTEFKSCSNRVFWIPDFQEKYLPHLFSEKEIESRTSIQEAIANHQKYVIFSSRDTQSSFNRFFPQATVMQFVIPFAVSHPYYDSLDKDELLKKYKISVPYFFSPNQFWVHKNHIVVLRALKINKDKGVDICVVFSGKEYDHRNPAYFEEIQKYVQDNGLENNTRFLGFIDRKEQLKLMSLSLAVIQPSKFEGWSTVIEDAKVMNKFVIASAIAVHQEQLKRNVEFFNEDDAHELADKLVRVSQAPPAIEKYDYAQDVRKFGQSFLQLIQCIEDKSRT